VFVCCHSAKEFVQALLAQLPDPVAELMKGRPPNILFNQGGSSFLTGWILTDARRRSKVNG
jgi:hypothetical protein